MKRVLNLLIILLLTVVGIGNAYAADFGVSPEKAETRYVVTDGKKLNVRSKASTKGNLIYQLRPGDRIYMDSCEYVQAGGYNWLRINHKWDGRNVSEGYLATTERLRAEKNPLYVQLEEGEKDFGEKVAKSHAVVKWILLALSLIAALVYFVAYFDEHGMKRILGDYNQYGMRRTFFFNIAPYRSIICMTLMLILAVVTAVAIMLVVGGLVFGVLWLVKILCYVLLWAGIILCVISIICCLCGYIPMVVGAIIGGLIWYWEDPITGFGEQCAATGLSFFNQFNMLGYTADLFMQYWRPALTIVCTPLALFFALAIIWLTIAEGLIIYEKIVTARYSIKHPCPHCQQNSEPATYLSKGNEGYTPLPGGLQLRPGTYGLFHITHPFTREKMPTMLMNGRDQLARICNNCGKRIKAEEGTEQHIAMVGTAQSGKSTLTYRLIAELFARGGEDRVEFTDVANSILDKFMINKVKVISAKGRIDPDDLPAKTRTNDLASTQLIIKRKNVSIPYRLFINDVGGELFDPENSAQSTNTGRYFSNVDSILMMLDPMTTDFTDCDTSSNFDAWVKKHDDGSVKLKIRDIQDTVDNQISNHGATPGRIHLNLVLPKIDLGYLGNDTDINSAESIESFMREEMGLGDLLNWARKFASCHLYAVGAMSVGSDSNIQPLLDEVIGRQLGIKL